MALMVMVAMEKLGVTRNFMTDLADCSYSSIKQSIANLGLSPLPESNYRNKRYSIKDVRKVIAGVRKDKKLIKRKINVFYNFKGGVGKTSTCYQISTHLALMGYNVLVIDSDPQANLTSCLGVRESFKFSTLFDVIVNDVSIKEATLSIFEGLDLVPSNISMTRLEPELNSIPKREEQLKFVLESVLNDYDYICIDTNPNINLINRNAIACADILNIVCETQPLSIMGMAILLKDIDNFYKSMRSGSPVLNIIPNKYEERTSTSSESMVILKEQFSQFMQPDFAVRKSEDFNQSIKNAEPLAFFAKKNSIAWEDMLFVIKNIINLSKE